MKSGSVRKFMGRCCRIDFSRPLLDGLGAAQIEHAFEHRSHTHDLGVDVFGTDLNLAWRPAVGSNAVGPQVLCCFICSPSGTSTPAW